MKAPFAETTDLPGVHAHAIAQLSRDLRLPLNEVADVYQRQLDHIGATARLHHYLGVLATSRARGILRREHRSS